MTGQTFDVGEALRSDHPADLVRVWQMAGERRYLEKVIARARADHELEVLRVHEQALAELPQVSALEALQANQILVDRMTGWRWIEMQHAREQKASWSEIGAALGMTKQAAYDYYQRKIEAQEQNVPDIHDAARARSVLGEPAPADPVPTPADLEKLWPEGTDPNNYGPVHMRDGIAPAGSKYRAYCTCGHRTTPRVSQQRAAAALATEHSFDPPLCVLCGRDRGPAVDVAGRWMDLEIVDAAYGRKSVDPTADQVLVCRTDTHTCHELARQRTLHADRATHESLGVGFTPPRLRALDGGRGHQEGSETDE